MNKYDLSVHLIACAYSLDISARLWTLCKHPVGNEKQIAVEWVYL